MRDHDEKKQGLFTVRESNDLAANCVPCFADAYVANTLSILARDVLTDFTGCKKRLIDFGMAYLSLECPVEDACSENFIELMALIAGIDDYEEAFNAPFAILMRELVTGEVWNAQGGSWQQSYVSSRCGVAANIWRDLMLRYGIDHIVDCAKELIIDLSSFKEDMDALIRGTLI